MTAQLTRSVLIRPARHVLLAVLLLGAASAPVMSQGMAAGAAGPHQAMHHGMGRSGAEHPMMSGRVLDAVGASADQQARIQQIMRQAHDETAKQRDADRALHQQMLALMAAPQIDAAAAENLRQQLQTRRDAASKRHLQAMLDSAAVLTAEQRAKLAERLKTRGDMMERHHRERSAAGMHG